MVGQVTWKDELDSSLDVVGAEGGLLLVSGESGGLNSDALEDVVDEGVHDSHALLGDTGLAVDVLKHAVDVHGVGVELLLSDSLFGFS